jgi:L,D-peptidoglycan transpeptidase YkuD (ErfK/YbiS/YcfS/YnhG family)
MPGRPFQLALALAVLPACGATSAAGPAATVASTATTTTTATAAAPPAPGIQAAPVSGHAATVEAPAVRDGPFAVDRQCDLTTVEALAARHPDAHQLIVMSTASFGATTGTVEVAVETSGGWRCQLDPQPARFGSNGTLPLIERRSGDGTTPAGVFPLGEVTAWDGEVFSMFGNEPDPGVLAPYRDVRPEDCWGATPNDPDYQHLVEHPNCPGPDDEDLERIGGVYAHAAVIGANLDPISGDAPGETPYAAAIFLHRHDYAGTGTSSGPTEPTRGCVSLAYDPLVDTLRLIDPARAPHFAIGPVAWLRTQA